MSQLPSLIKRFKIAIGVSRKSWIGRFLHLDCAQDRDNASKIAELFLLLSGASLIRTHNVAPLARVRQVVEGRSEFFPS